MTAPRAIPALPPNLIGVPEVAAQLGVSRMTIYRLITREDLRAYRIGKSIRLDPRDVAAYVRSNNTITWELNAGGAA